MKMIEASKVRALRDVAARKADTFDNGQIDAWYRDELDALLAEAVEVPESPMSNASLHPEDAPAPVKRWRCTNCKQEVSDPVASSECPTPGYWHRVYEAYGEYWCGPVVPEGEPRR